MSQTVPDSEPEDYLPPSTARPASVVVLGLLYALLVFLPLASPDADVDMAVTGITAPVFFTWTIAAGRLMGEGLVRAHKAFGVFAISVWLITSGGIALRSAASIMPMQLYKSHSYPVVVEGLGTEEVARTIEVGWKNTVSESQGFRYWCAGFYRNGKSVCRTKAGQLLREAWYRDDILDGPIRTWYPSGARRAEGTLRDGRLVGSLSVWNEDGTPHGVADFSRMPSGSWSFAGMHWIADTPRDRRSCGILEGALGLHRYADGRCDTVYGTPP